MAANHLRAVSQKVIADGLKFMRAEARRGKGYQVHGSKGAVLPRKQPGPNSRVERAKLWENRMETSFDRFWSAYPKRQGSNPKAPAEAKFSRAVANGANPEAIIGGARQYANALGPKVGTEYVAMATTWLNQKRWQDYQPAEALPLAAPAKVFVEYDSPQWQAWSKLRRWPQHDFKVDGRYRRGWYFDSEWPNA